MKLVTNEYQLAFNTIKLQIKDRIRELQIVDSVAGLDDYLEIELDTLEGILQNIEHEESIIKGVKK